MISEELAHGPSVNVPTKTGKTQRKLEKEGNKHRANERCEMKKGKQEKRRKEKMKERRRTRTMTPDENNDINYIHQIIDPGSMVSGEVVR